MFLISNTEGNDTNELEYFSREFFFSLLIQHISAIVATILKIPRNEKSVCFLKQTTGVTRSRRQEQNNGKNILLLNIEENRFTHLQNRSTMEIYWVISKYEKQKLLLLNDVHLPLKTKWINM